MKYAIIAGLVTVAVATPQWEAVPSKKVDPTTSTWNEWENVKSTTTSTSTWNEWENVKTPDPTTWNEWETAKKPEPTKDIDWEEWHKKPSYTTTVVTAITTYCSEPTKIVHAGKTWDVTKATTLTITDCPCTISVPVYTKTSTSCASKATDDDWENYPVGCKNGKDKYGKDCKIPEDAATTWANYVKSTPVKGTDSASTWAAWQSASVPVKDASSTWAAWESASVPASSVKSSTGTWATWASSTGPAIAKWTGAAQKVNVGAGLAGVAGIAALLL